MSSFQWQERKRLWEGKGFILSVWDSFICSSARMIEGQKVCTFFIRPNLKVSPYNENCPIWASRLPFSLMKAKSYPGAAHLSWSRHQISDEMNCILCETASLHWLKEQIIKQIQMWTLKGELNVAIAGWDERSMQGERDWVVLVRKPHYIVL